MMEGGWGWDWRFSDDGAGVRDPKVVAYFCTPFELACPLEPLMPMAVIAADSAAAILTV